VISALAAPKPSTANVSAFPGTLANARYVYIDSYDGDQFDTNLLPEDRNAIGAVQDAIQTWGKLTRVDQPSEADIVILVTSRPSEDVMAVYDAHQHGLLKSVAVRIRNCCALRAPVRALQPATK
jgi:predicted Zn-dependent protease